MIAWGSKHIILIVSLFLASFLGAFTIKVLCGLNVIEYASNLSHEHENISHTPAHQDGTNHDHGTNHQENSINHQSSSPVDECCDDAVNRFELSLYSGILKFAVPMAKYFVTGIIEFINCTTPLYQSDNIIFHEYDDPPPLNGFSLRVIIQSFLT